MNSDGWDKWLDSLFGFLKISRTIFIETMLKVKKLVFIFLELIL